MEILWLAVLEKSISRPPVKVTVMGMVGVGDVDSVVVVVVVVVAMLADCWVSSV